MDGINMTQERPSMSDSAQHDISVVIPSFNASEHMQRLLVSISAQTVLPREVVIVDSSSNDATAVVVKEWKGTLPILYKKLDLAYPGHARNVGVTLARGKWIAFLDCRTVPDTRWLELCIEAAQKTGAGLVAAIFTGNPNTHFQQIMHAATYGNILIRSVPGSLILKDVFLDSGGFNPTVRAGEDLEWFDRVQRQGIRIVNPGRLVLVYEGYPTTLKSAIKKWYVYSKSVSSLEIVKNQKLIYGITFLLLLMLIAYKWNSYVGRGNEQSIFYVPHITKMVLALILACYGVYRGLIRPLQRKIKISFLLPYRWLEICAVGFCLDLAKAPGLLLGALMMIKRRIPL